MRCLIAAYGAVLSFIDLISALIMFGRRVRLPAVLALGLAREPRPNCGKETVLSFTLATVAAEDISDAG
jgi:hypothetical protein